MEENSDYLIYNSSIESLGQNMDISARGLPSYGARKPCNIIFNLNMTYR